MASALLAGLSCLLVASTPSLGEADLPGYCVQCLCEAVAGVKSCVFPGTCHSGVCGPFAITMPYWQDSGRPTKGLEDRNSLQTYENCALDPSCAEATIRGYMNSFHQDCNMDGVEDCWDFAAIHFHGGYGCNKPLNVPAKNALGDCLQRLNPSKPKPPPFIPTPKPPTPRPPVVPETPVPEEPVDPNENDVIYPTQPTTYPSIDVRLGK